MKKLPILILMCLLLLPLVQALDMSNMMTVMNQYTSRPDWIRGTNQSNENFTFDTVTANSFVGNVSGSVNWSDVQNKFITAVDNIYIYMSGTTATLNETKLNNTIQLNPKNWTKLQNYPAVCPAYSYLTQLNDSVTCTAISHIDNSLTVNGSVNITNDLRVDGNITFGSYLIVPNGTDEGVNAAIDAGAKSIMVIDSGVVDATITIDNEFTTLQGIGIGTALDSSAGQTFHTIDLNGIDYNTIRDLQIIGNDGGGQIFHQIYGLNSIFTTIQNNYLKDADNAGIFLDNAHYSQVYANVVENADGVGLNIDGQSLRAFGNYFYNCASWGIASNALQTAIFGNVADGSAGISLKQSRVAAFGNIFELSSGYSGINNDATNSVVFGNVMNDPTYGIRQLDPNFAVFGNYIEDFSISGIEVHTATQQGVVALNVIRDGRDGTNDIKFLTNNYLSLTLGNVLLGDVAGSERGIYDVNGHYNIHAFNIFNDHGTAGIELGPGTNNSIVFGNMLETETNRIVDNSGTNTNIIWDFDTANLTVKANSGLTLLGDVGIGTANPSHKLNVVGSANITKNVIVVGNFTGNQIYGGMWWHNHTGFTLTFAVQDTWYPLFFANATDLNGFSYVGGINESSNLTSLIGGKYQVSYMGIGSGENNEIYLTTILVDGVEKHECGNHWKMAAGGDVITQSGVCIITINAGDNVQLATQNMGATGDGVYYGGNINLVRIGD